MCIHTYEDFSVMRVWDWRSNNNDTNTNTNTNNNSNTNTNTNTNTILILILILIRILHIVIVTGRPWSAAWRAARTWRISELARLFYRNILAIRYRTLLLLYVL